MAKNQQSRKSSRTSSKNKSKHSLKQSSLLSWKILAPALFLFALIGGYFVYSTFADSALKAGQYSVYHCSNNNNFNPKNIKPGDECVAHGAEAYTIRLYKGLLARNPDKSGYQYWVQKLAGDHMSVADVASQFIKDNKALQTKSNDIFVEDLYKNMLLRSSDPSGKKYWVDRLNNKTWTRQKVAAHFAATNEAIKRQEAYVASYLQSTPRVAVIKARYLPHQFAGGRIVTDSKGVKYRELAPGGGDVYTKRDLTKGEVICFNGLYLSKGKATKIYSGAMGVEGFLTDLDEKITTSNSGSGSFAICGTVQTNRKGVKIGLYTMGGKIGIYNIEVK